MAIFGQSSCGLPIDSTGVIQNAVGAGSGTTGRGKNGFWINANGQVATNTVQSSPTLNSFGFLQNADGSIVTTTTAASAYINAFGFLCNPGGILVTAISGGTIINSSGVLCKTDGTAITLA